MITPLSNAKPFIDFGFGTIEKQAAQGETVTVWLSTIYNQSAYSFTLNVQNATVTTISAYEYQLVFNTPGSHEISLIVVPKTKKPSLQSNILTLTVV